MSCNGLGLGGFGKNNACLWTLIIFAILFLWLNCCNND